jgi:hypothetical protein
MQIDRAIKINKRLSIPQLQRVQCLVGAPPHGRSDEQTARAVAAWQASIGLDADGQVGPMTLDALEGVEAETWQQLKRTCLYWDLPAARTASSAPALATRLSDLGIDHVQTMLDSTSDDHLDWSTKQLDAWSLSLQARGISHGLTIWAMPDRARMRERREMLPALLDAARATVVGLDVEEHCVRHDLEGYASREEATVDMIDLLDEVGETRATMVSSYPDLLGVEDTTAAQILAVADYAEMQVYGRASKAGGQWAHPRYGVATAQHWGLGRWRKRYAAEVERKRKAREDAGLPALPAPKAPAVVAALASWGQTWPGGQKPEEARYLAALSAVYSGAEWLADWSAKHCIGFAGSVSDRGEKSRYNKAFYARVQTLRGRDGSCR